MLKNNKINIYGCLLKLIYTPVFATERIRLKTEADFFWLLFRIFVYLSLIIS